MSPKSFVPVVLIGSLLAAGCSFVGPASISNGRMAYNEVISHTEDQQILNAIVRERYGESFGMLTVASVAANVRFSASVNAEFGIGPSENYGDNLVPLSLGAAYEENPTISYVPLQGAAVIRTLVAPISVEESLLLLEASKDRHIVNRLLYRRINDLELPMDGPFPPEARKAEEIWNRLRDRGILRLGRALGGEPDRTDYVVILSGYRDQDCAAIEDLLDLLGIAGQAVDGRKILIPFGQSVDLDPKNSVRVETRSVLDWLRLAASMVEVPAAHHQAGIVGADAWRGLPEDRFITIHSSKHPPKNAVVSVAFRHWWFYVDATDSRSKDSFQLIRLLVRLRLNPEGLQQQVPVLTVPVR